MHANALEGVSGLDGKHSFDERVLRRAGVVLRSLGNEGEIENAIGRYTLGQRNQFARFPAFGAGQAAHAHDIQLRAVAAVKDFDARHPEYRGGVRLTVLGL